MGRTMASKILARASDRTDAGPGEIVLPKVEFVTCLDGAPFIDAFSAQGLRVWDPDRVLFCFDHAFQPDWMPVVAASEHPKIRRFARDQGIPLSHVYDYGRNGLSHQIPVEEGWALPGTVAVGLDTQTSTMGAANCFAIAGGFGTEAVLLTGDLWMQVPESIRVHVTGALEPGVTGKDVTYHLLRDLHGRVNGRVLEFSGPGLRGLPLDARMAIANGSVQIGALTSVFPADRVLLDHLAGRARHEFAPVAPDDDAEYVETYECDLSTVDNLIAGPHEIERVRPLTELLGLEVQAVNIGSCSSGRLSDLTLAAEVLRDRQIAPGVRLIVTPISARVARDAAAGGVLQVLLDAGATVSQPGCGGCYHGNLSPLKLGDGERCLSTSVETLRGRMGSTEAEILLGSAAVAAASAIEGRVADPRLYLAPSSTGPEVTA